MTIVGSHIRPVDFYAALDRTFRTKMPAATVSIGQARLDSHSCSQRKKEKATEQVNMPVTNEPNKITAVKLIGPVDLVGATGREVTTVTSSGGRTEVKTARGASKRSYVVKRRIKAKVLKGYHSSVVSILVLLVALTRTCRATSLDVESKVNFNTTLTNAD